MQARAPEWEHLGLNGPLIRGAVGDTLRVTFRNMLTTATISMHPHGVLYSKNSEGSPYNDGTSGRWGCVPDPPLGGLGEGVPRKLPHHALDSKAVAGFHNKELQGWKSLLKGLLLQGWHEQRGQWGLAAVAGDDGLWWVRAG